MLPTHTCLYRLPNVVWWRVLLALLLAAALMLASACGGGTGRGSGKPAEMIEVQLSGQVTNGPVAGAIVEVLDASGQLLAATTTTTGGLFGPVRVQVPDVNARYRLVTFGGEHDNRPYVGNLRAVCDGAQLVVNCTLTPITTVVAVLVSEYNMAPGSARFQVLNRMRVSSDPFVTPSQRFDRTRARAAMDNGRLLDTWVSDFVSWVLAVEGAGPPPGVVVSDTPVEIFNLRYSVGRGGSIDGEAVQLLQPGDVATTVTALPDPGYVFVRWSDGLTSASRTDGPLQGDLSVSAVFGPVPGNQVLSVFRTGPGSGRVASDVRGIDCGETCRASMPAGVEIVLAAFPDAESVFTGWGDACAGSGTSCVLILGDKSISVSASFEAATYALSLSVEGVGEGKVTTTPVALECHAQCEQDFAYGQEVLLTAVADEGSVFSGWSGDCAGSQSQCRVSMTQARSVRAGFVIPQPQLQMVIAGAGSGQVHGAGIQCQDSCVQTVIEGSMVTLTATADAGSVFAGWSGPCAGTSPECTTVISVDTLVMAHFDVQPSNIKRLSVLKSGGGAGAVTDGLGIDCGTNCNADYGTGQTRTLVAYADTGSAVSHWAGCDSAVGGICTVTLDTNRTITAEFVEAMTVPFLATVTAESYEVGSVGPHRFALTFSHVIRVDESPVGDTLGVTNATVTASECGAFFSYEGGSPSQDFLGNCSVTFLETNTNVATDGRTECFHL